MTPSPSSMWRVKYAEGNASGNGSGGDWAYYEAHNFDQMEGDLLEALLNSDCGDGREFSSGNLLSRILRKHRKPDVHDDPLKWRRHKVIEVAYLDGDQWVPVEVSWTPPAVLIRAASAEGE